MKTPILLITLLLLNCLKASRSPFDINSPSGALGSGIVFSFDSNSSKQSDNSSTYSIGGSITGFTSGTLVLQLNGGSDVSLTPANSYQLGTVGLGTTYTVTIKTNPSGFTCTIANGTGTATANVTNADITCTSSSVTTNYTIGGNITGFTSGTLVLQLNGGSDMSLSPTSSYQVGSVSSGASYVVTIKTNPTGLTCTIVNGTGTATANVTNADITCTATAVASYTIGGSVSGLTSGVLVLRNNGGNDLTVNAGVSSFQFTSSVASGSTYAVTIQSQPSSLTCSVANGSGTATANVTNLSVTCAVITYTVGGTISGLSSGSLVIQNNGGNDLNISAGSTSFVFTTAIASGSAYAVTILTPASGLTCSVGNGSGTISANVTNVAITCATTTYTIGGTITGLTTGQLVVQNNATNDFTINSSAASFQFTTAVAHNSAYSVTVKQHPTGLVCSLTNTTGTATANVTNVSVSCSTAVVSPLYTTNGRNWNDYINRDFTNDIFTQADTACNTANTGGYRTCVHAGEIRKFDLPSRSVCTNLTGSDSAGALNWICKPNGSGGVTFYSSGLKKGKYLSDLIDWTTNNWASLTFTVTESTTPHLQTQASTSWWVNGIAVNSNTFAISQINLFTANPSASQLSIGATDKVSIICKPGILCKITPTGSGCGTFQAISSSGKFNWVEGSWDTDGIPGVASVNAGLHLNTAFTVVRNFKIQNAGQNPPSACPFFAGIYLIGNSGNNYLEDVVVANSKGAGILISNSNSNFINNVLVSISSGKGIDISTSNTKNTTIIGATVMNNGSYNFGCDVSSVDNLFFNILAANSVSYGFHCSSNFNNTIFRNIAALNNGNDGFNGTNMANATFENFISLSNSVTAAGINLNTGSNLNLRGVFKTGGNGGAYCSIASFAPAVSCANTNMSAPDQTAILDDATLPSSLKLYGTPNITPVITENGLSTGSGSTPTNWLSFGNFFRGVGRFATGAFPNTSHQGICTTSCSLWDFSLKSSDSALRNVNITSGTGCPSGNSTFTHTWSGTASGQAYCDANYPGSVVSGSTCVTTVLRNSVELINDGVGNDNGICESNEDCLFTPNIGAYQGHGSIVSANTATTPATTNCPDIGTGGTIQNVKLYKYETNGY